MLAEDFPDEDGSLAAVGMGDKGRKAVIVKGGLALGIGAHGDTQEVDVMHGGEIIAEVVVNEAVFRIVIAVEDSENIHRAGEDVFGDFRNIVADGKQQGGDLRQTGAALVACKTLLAVFADDSAGMGCLFRLVAVCVSAL